MAILWENSDVIENEVSLVTQLYRGVSKNVEWQDAFQKTWSGRMRFYSAKDHFELTNAPCQNG